MNFNIDAHLIGRYFNTAFYDGCTVTEDSMTVMLWNLSGQLIGYQIYSPLNPKKSKVPEDAKYFTHLTEGKDAVFGLESTKWNAPLLFVCEGIFDAARLHDYGIPAIAVLGNNPTHLTSWLSTLPHTSVAAVQGDKAGMFLALCTDKAVFLPEGEDVSSLSEEDFTKFFKQYFDL